MVRVHFRLFFGEYFVCSYASVCVELVKRASRLTSQACRDEDEGDVFFCMHLCYTLPSVFDSV